MSVFVGLFHTARMEGLGVTLHIAEVRLSDECRDSPNHKV
jgi:hypothetical protein